jgi:hypothetical protein
MITPADALRSTSAVSEHDVSEPRVIITYLIMIEVTKVPGECELMCRTEAKRGANVVQSRKNWWSGEEEEVAII